MNYNFIISEYTNGDKRYPISNLKRILLHLYPKSNITSNTEDKGEYGEVTTIKVPGLLNWIYLVKGNSYALAVRFVNGLYWIQLESQESTYPDITEDTLTELKWYTDQIKLGDEVKSDVYKYESESGSIYVQDLEKVSCTCPNFKYRTGHFPESDERRLCKHLSSIYRFYPELLPTAIQDSDKASAQSVNGKTRYPRAMFDMYILDIKSTLDQFSHLINKYEVCGSYRRLNPMVSDLDFLIELKPDVEWDDMLDYFQNIKGWKLMTNIGRGSAKAAYLIDGFVHVDFKCVNKENWPFALLHFTGSKSNNIEMRRVANGAGYRLNEYGLFSEVTGESVEGLSTEEDIYNFLGLTYRHPWDR